MANITRRAVGTAATSATTSVTVSQPTGTADNDVLIAVIVDRTTSSSNSTPPTGWTAVAVAQTASYGRMQIFMGVKGLNDLTGTFWQFTGLQTRSMGVIVGYYNVDTANYLDTDVSARANLSSPTLATGTTGITTATDNAMVIAVFTTSNGASTWSNESTPNVSVTEIFDNVYTTYISIAIADGLKATAGATGNSSATMGTAQANHGALIALRPGAIVPPLLMMMGVGT